MLNSLILFICCLLPKRHKAPVASLSFPLCSYQSYICLLEGQTQPGQGNGYLGPSALQILGYQWAVMKAKMMALCSFFYFLILFPGKINSTANYSCPGQMLGM